jgi:hypothetical protein
MKPAQFRKQFEALFRDEQNERFFIVSRRGPVESVDDCIDRSETFCKTQAEVLCWLKDRNPDEYVVQECATLKGYFTRDVDGHLEQMVADAKLRRDYDQLGRESIAAGLNYQQRRNEIEEG